MSRSIEFLMIGGSTPTSSGPGFNIAGRCLDGPIFAGDVFSEVREGENHEPTRLVIEQILAYGKVLSQLDPVVTAQLTLSGDLPASLTDHAVLAGTSEE